MTSPHTDPPAAATEWGVQHPGNEPMVFEDEAAARLEASYWTRAVAAESVVAAIRDLAAEIEASTSECGEWWMARERGLERPERLHYPDEGWAFCDGCSAAQAGDYDSKAIAVRIRAALEEPSDV